MIAEKNGITVDTRTAAPARKMIKCPQKTGINLNLQEDRQRDRRTLLIGILAIAALVTVVVNFGVLQQYRRLDKAQAAYDRVHTQYVSAQEALSDYDRVLLEYRTYSMDWMTAAGSEDIPAAVDRQAALDLLEQEMLSCGSLTSLQITQNTMNVDMSGMTLDQISAMFARLRLSPIVDSVSLSVASTEEGKAATIMDFTVRIELRQPEEVRYFWFTPACLRHQYTKPEQSNLSGPLPPFEYRQPILLWAAEMNLSTLPMVPVSAPAPPPDELLPDDEPPEEGL